MTRSRLKFFPIFLVLLLAGCVNVRTPKPTQQTFRYIPFKSRQAKLKNIRDWQAKGAFSIQTTGQKPVIAAYSWKQQGQQDSTIRISSTLNLYNILIIRRPSYVVLWKNAKESYRASNSEQLMQRILGWSLPISDMIYWIKGMEAPGKVHAKLDRYGRLRNLSQKGWNIMFGSYERVAANDLPRVIYLTRPGFKVKIVIRNWLLSS